MINEKVLDFLKAKGYADRLTEHKETIDTVEHAAQQIGCSEAEIAKTLSFIVDEKPVIVVMTGVMSVRAGKNSFVLGVSAFDLLLTYQCKSIFYKFNKSFCLLIFSILKMKYKTFSSQLIPFKFYFFVFCFNRNNCIYLSFFS